MLFSLPLLLAAIVVAVVFGAGYWMTVLLLILLFSPSDIRIVRAGVMEQAARPFVEATQMLSLLGVGFAPGTADWGRQLTDGRAIMVDNPDAVWRATRGRRISLLLQDPFTSLSPVHRCGAQIGITIEGASDRRLGRDARTALIIQSLAEVNLPADVASAYPQELSGGMRQATRTLRRSLRRRFMKLPLTEFRATSA